MNRCLSEHNACIETFSGATLDESEPPMLPTRVLHVGPGQDVVLQPRLFETNGKKAHYIALSHCWGRKKPPLMTTSFSLERHIGGIPWIEIPRAYQDAITVTRRLGFEYIWIDSLCISVRNPSMVPSHHLTESL
jgi:hypothetical protein